MTTFKASIQADWAPAIKFIARALGWLVAVAIVLAQWAQFTHRRPRAGLQAVISSPRSVTSSPRSAGRSPRSGSIVPLMLMPAAPVLMLAAGHEPIPAAAPPARKRKRRATRQPKAA